MGKRVGNSLELPGLATPTGNPPAGSFLIYFKADGLLYRKDSTGAETTVGGSGGSFEPPIAGSTSGQFWRGDKTWSSINGYNLIVNPGFEDSTTSYAPHWVPATIDWATSGVPRSGARAGHFASNVAIAGSADVFVAHGQSTATYARASVGETYRAEFWVRNGASGVNFSGLRAWVKGRDGTGVTMETVYGTVVTTSNNYTLISAEITIANAGTQYIVCGLNVATGMALNDQFRVDDMSLRLVPQVGSIVQSALDNKADFTYAQTRDLAVMAASTVNVPTLSGAATIDGVSVAAGVGNLVLLKNQTTASQNGVYFVNSGAWSRMYNFGAGDQSALYAGHVRVERGTANGGELWANTFRATDTVDTTAMAWYQVTTNNPADPVVTRVAALEATPGPYSAPTGTWQLPNNFFSSGIAASTAGVVYFSPVDVGPITKSFDQIGVGVTTAQVAGSTTTTLGLYADDGTGGAPRLAGGPLYSGTITVNAGGNRPYAVAMNLAPGRYWMAFLYVVTTAPTTAPQFNCINNATGIWSSSATTIGGVSRALQVTAGSQTVLPTTAVPLTIVGNSTCPVIALRAA